MSWSGAHRGSHAHLPPEQCVWPLHLSWVNDLLSVTFLLPQEEAEEDSDLSDYGDDADGRKDALAEPCFMLIGEIFELRGSKPLCYDSMVFSG